MPVVDELAHVHLGGLVARSITSDAASAELGRLAVGRSYRAVLRCGNGQELACAACGTIGLREGVEARRECAAPSGRRGRCHGGRW